MPAGVLTPETIVIAGSGQAGFQAAASLRERGYGGRVLMIGDEAGLPYQRPPLSKAYLNGAVARAALDLRPLEFFNKHAIEMSCDRVTRIDRNSCAVYTSSGQAHRYDHLILATGARNRVLDIPGHDLGGIFQLRTAEETDRLRSHLVEAKRIAIIGAGFIGLEIAALATSMDKDVIVIEATDRVMARAISRPTSRFFKAAHEHHNVRFLFETRATAFHGAEGRVSAIEMGNGPSIQADFVLIGVGVVANDELARTSSLATRDGIVVDELLQTSDRRISAIGDCALFPHPLADSAAIRIESVQNAADQARCVAARLTGDAQPYRAVPWFWSEQGSLKLQIAGLSAPHDLAVTRGDEKSGAFSVFCFRNGHLNCVESVNKPADHMVARRLLASNATLTPAEAADVTFDLKARAVSNTKAAA